MSDIKCLLQQLTQEAIEAARAGKWDQVITLYERRRSIEQINPLSSEIIQMLMKGDEWLISRIQHVQLAIQQNIFDIQNQGRKLASLKHRWGENSAAQARHLLSI
jgi:hypothetical protein